MIRLMTTPMVLFLLIAVVFPLALLCFEKKKFKARIKPFLIGALIWFLFTQVLEKTLHLVILTKTNITSYPLILAVYGGLAAGIFEEVGRYWAFSQLLKKYRKWKDALAYGTGHGGFESIYLGIMIPLQAVLLSKAGPEQLSALANISAESLKILTESMQNYGYWLVSGVERIMVIIFHITLSFIVFYAVRSKKIKFLFIAILYHAIVDFPAALFQASVINLWLVELILFILTIGNIYLIIKSKKLLADL